MASFDSTSIAWLDRMEPVTSTTSACIEHRQASEWLTIGARIGHEIVVPHRIGGAAASSVLESLHGPQPAALLLADLGAFAPKTPGGGATVAGIFPQQALHADIGSNSSARHQEQAITSYRPLLVASTKGRQAVVG